MTLEHKEAFGLLEKSDNILVLTHRNPDGDAVGSAFALFGIVAVVFLTLVFASAYTPIGVIIMLVMLFGLCTFISTYVAYPQMKKFMITLQKTFMILWLENQQRKL